jgi:hypothetical protein
MANEKEIKQLDSIIASMKSASYALVKVYPGGSIALKYMSEDIKVMITDLKGRDAVSESQRRLKGIPGVDRAFTQAEMNTAHAKMHRAAI